MMSGQGTVAVAEYLFRGDAEVARALLDSQGIKAHVRADDEGGLNPGFFSDYRVVLEVNAADAGEALVALGHSILVPDEIQAGMRAHTEWAYPNEACGLLAGGDGVIEMVFCLSNRDASPTRYTIDPGEHYGAMRFAEEWFADRPSDQGVPHRWLRRLRACDPSIGLAWPIWRQHPIRNRAPS
jgi:hypothetical protein